MADSTLIPTTADLGRKVKAKHPGAYDDLPDDEVGRRVQQRFPGAYDDFVAAPDSVARAAASNRDLAGQTVQPEDSMSMPLHPYGGAPVVSVSPSRLAQDNPTLGPIANLPSSGMGDVMTGADELTQSGQRMAGLHHILSGVGKVLSPALGYGAIAAPLATLGGVVGGGIGGGVANLGARMAGASDNAADLAGDVGGLAGGYAGAEGGVMAKGLNLNRDAALSMLKGATNAYGDIPFVGAPVKIMKGAVDGYKKYQLAHPTPIPPPVSAVPRQGAVWDGVTQPTTPAPISPVEPIPPAYPTNRASVPAAAPPAPPTPRVPLWQQGQQAAAPVAPVAPAAPAPSPAPASTPSVSPILPVQPPPPQPNPFAITPRAINQPEMLAPGKISVLDHAAPRTVDIATQNKIHNLTEHVKSLGIKGSDLKAMSPDERNQLANDAIETGRKAGRTVPKTKYGSGFDGSTGDTLRLVLESLQNQGLW